jgi:hypothetical protein
MNNIDKKAKKFMYEEKEIYYTPYMKPLVDQYKELLNIE